MNRYSEHQKYDEQRRPAYIDYRPRGEERTSSGLMTNTRKRWSLLLHVCQDR
jgi:hypothetical protein